jgi:zinc D-Ala-D-Ala carboxypeptidase
MYSFKILPHLVNKLVKKFISVWIVLILSIAIVGCDRDNEVSSSSRRMQSKTDESLTPLVNVPNSNQPEITKASCLNKETTPDGRVVYTTKYPPSIAVVVNKKIYLPKNYAPMDLVYPKVSFIFKEYIGKRKIRKEAAIALERMFAGAKNDGIYLSGASG